MNANDFGKAGGASEISVPIHDHDLERAVLGNLMTSFDRLVETADILDDRCFHSPSNRDIYLAIKAIYADGHIPDLMLVSNRLAHDRSPVTPLEVTEICINSSPLSDIREHAAILRDLGYRRTLRELGSRLMSQSGMRSVAVDRIRSDADNSIRSLFESGSDSMSTLKDTYRSLQEHMLILNSREENEIFGTSTGFDALDRNGGMCPGDLIVIGAETSQGKTAFATALAVSAISKGHGVAFYSMEMTDLQLSARIASMRSGIPSSRLLFEKLDMKEIYLVDHAMESIDMSKLHFDSRSTVSLESILLSIRTMVLRHGIKGAVVDYLQLINARNSASNREQATARCARELKNIAKELGIWVVLISQLSRDRQSPTPSLSRLRDSGQIEEAADMILLIYRPRDGQSYPEPYSSVNTDGTAMVTIAKGRNTGTGSFICGFKKENTLFYPLTANHVNALKINNSKPKEPEFPMYEGLGF